MKYSTIIAALALVVGSCANVAASEPLTIKERFFTPLNIDNNVDSIAVWHKPNSEQRLLVATAKGTHKLFVYDAENGYPISEYGSLGEGLGEFDRPNGIAIVDDLAFVVERDNHRVQILRLPDFSPVGAFGLDELMKPYGIYVRKMDGNSYQAYVTDDYNTNSTKRPEPNPNGIKKRVKRYEVSVSTNNLLKSNLLNAFGSHTGPNALNVVESIMGDPQHDRLMLADEDEVKGLDIHVFDLEGNDTGKTLGKGLFQFQPEGIALWQTSAKGGYWVFTDQGKLANHYHVFSRKTLKHVASFQGERTLNTDGVAIDYEPSASYSKGLFYAIHFDSGVTAWSLADIAKAAGLRN